MKLSQVYRYGLLDSVNAESVDKQINLAHTYRNKLVELELARRADCAAAIACESLSAIEQEIKNASREERPSLWKKRNALLTARRKEVAPALEAARSGKYAAIREARQAVRDQGLFWGTYLTCEQAAEAAASQFDAPKFKRRSRKGAVAVQLQGGLAIAELLRCGDTRARLNLTPIPVPGRRGKARSGKALPRLSIRIGSNGRAPIWAEWPIVYHRPLPDGTIKWIKIIRDQTASREWWSAHIMVERELEPSADGDGNALVLDLRWRKEEVDGQATQRAGEWTNGKQGGIIILDPSVVGELRKADDIRSIRDTRQNEMHAKALGLIKAIKLPEEHAERVAHMVQWENPGRFAGLAIWWRTNRIDGDQEFFGLLEAWRKRDKHLWLWEAHARSKALLRRKEQYRMEASRLVKTHAKLVLESITLDKLARVPEEDDPGQQKARSQRFATAPSNLRMAFVNCFRKEGKPIFTVKPGPLLTLWQAWCAKQGVEKKASAARSRRFNRLRKIQPVQP